MDKWMWRCCAPGSQSSSPRDARASPAAIPPVSASYHPKQIAASICNTMPIRCHNSHTDSALDALGAFHWVENLCLLNGCVLYKAFTSHLMWWFGGCLRFRGNWNTKLWLTIKFLHTDAACWESYGFAWLNQPYSISLHLVYEWLWNVWLLFQLHLQFVLCTADQCGTLGIFLTILLSKLFSLQQHVK